MDNELIVSNISIHPLHTFELIRPRSDSDFLDQENQITINKNVNER